jgi:hypothetical protein
MVDRGQTSHSNSERPVTAIGADVSAGCPLDEATLAEITSEPEIRGDDRRAALRRGFPHKQFVAPYHGGCLPSRVSFREVMCRDISATGFSFLSSQIPDFEALVVALGVAPNLTYMTARVVNRVQIADHPAPLYRIGCRFSGRLS